MPDKDTVEEAHELERAGKSPSTQAGAFVKAEIDKVRSGKHGVRNAKQAIAIGLSEARKAGVKIPARDASSRKKSTKSRASAEKKSSETSKTRSQAALRALKRESGAGTSKPALSAQTKSAAKKRGAADRSRSAKKAAATRKRAQS